MLTRLLNQNKLEPLKYQTKIFRRQQGILNSAWQADLKFGRKRPGPGHNSDARYQKEILKSPRKIFYQVKSRAGQKFLKYKIYFNHSTVYKPLLARGACGYQGDKNRAPTSI